MCDCIKTINALLAPKNAQLLVNLLDDTYTMVAVCKLDEKKRTKLPLVVASYCPFCREPTPGTKSNLNPA